MHVVGTVKDEDQIKPHLTPLVFKGPLPTFQAPSDHFGESRDNDNSSRSTNMGGGKGLRTLFPWVKPKWSQSRGTGPARATPSPPGPARGLASGTRLVPPRSTHLVPRQPRWRAAASDSVRSGASRIPSSWASPWWALTFTREPGRMRGARCGMRDAGHDGDNAHGPLSALPLPLGTEHGGFAWRARLAPPASARCSDPANQRDRGRSVPAGWCAWGDQVPLGSRWRLPTEGASDPLRSTPVSLGAYSPGPVRRDLIRASGFRATRRDTL